MRVYLDLEVTKLDRVEEQSQADRAEEGGMLVVAWAFGRQNRRRLGIGRGFGSLRVNRLRTCWLWLVISVDGSDSGDRKVDTIVTMSIVLEKIIIVPAC